MYNGEKVDEDKTEQMLKDAEMHLAKANNITSLISAKKYNTRPAFKRRATVMREGLRDLVERLIRLKPKIRTFSKEETN